MNKLIKRRQNYNTVSNILACTSNLQLNHLLANGDKMHTGIGGTSVKININNIPVFVKKIPLTDIELSYDNYMSTANIFNLPMCYQYGIGSTGFGAWRELAAHQITTNWVLTNKISNFPIMYHWRILKDVSNKIISSEEKLALDKDIMYWENNPEIATRLKSISQANHHIYLFMEFIPYNLYTWLNKQLTECKSEKAVKAINFVEEQMHRVNNFMGKENFLHMDAHFENILTDGDELYYSDFGLALFSGFDLDKTEQNFMQDNCSYDYASGMINLLHCIITSYFDKKTHIEDYFNNKLPILDKDINGIIQKYKNIGLIMSKFYPAIQKDKSVIYPFNKINRILNYD